MKAAPGSPALNAGGFGAILPANLYL